MKVRMKKCFLAFSLMLLVLVYAVPSYAQQDPDKKPHPTPTQMESPLAVPEQPLAVTTPVKSLVWEVRRHWCVYPENKKRYTVMGVSYGYSTVEIGFTYKNGSVGYYFPVYYTVSSVNNPQLRFSIYQVTYLKSTDVLEKIEFFGDGVLVATIPLSNVVAAECRVYYAAQKGDNLPGNPAGEK